MNNKTNFIIWKTIKIGTFKSVAELEEVLLSKCSINEVTATMLKNPNFKLSKEEKEINLVIVSSKELGLESFASFKEICEAAYKHGLNLCPKETGPIICISNYYFKKKSFCVAMEPINISTVKTPYIFNIIIGYTIGYNILVGCSGRPECIWSNSSKFLFCYS